MVGEYMKKKYLFLSFSVIGLVLFTVGLSLAIFNYTKNGSTDNTLITNGITFHYQEIDGDGRGISITNALPQSDEEAISSLDNVFNFEIESSPGSSDLGYTITARKRSNGDILDSAINLYLTDDNIDNPTVFLSKTSYSNLESYNNSNIEKILYKKIITSDDLDAENKYYQKFKLRMWLDESIDFSNSQYNNQEFSITINVNASKDTTNHESEYLSIGTKQYNKSTWFWVSDSTNEFDYITNQALREETIDRLKYAGITDIYLYIRAVITQEELDSEYYEFIKYANKKGINIYALEGYPDFIVSSNYDRTIYNYMDKISTFNRSHDDAYIKGVHYDIEFYTVGWEDYAGYWDGTDPNLASNNSRKKAYIDFAKAAYSYAKSKNLKVQYDVVRDLNNYTYVDDSSTTKNVLSELTNYSDELAVMYYVSMQKSINNSQSNELINSNILSLISDNHGRTVIASNLPNIVKDYKRVNYCVSNNHSEVIYGNGVDEPLVPLYIDQALADSNSISNYLTSYYDLEYTTLKNYSNNNGIDLKFDIGFHDVWDLLEVLEYENVVSTKRNSEFMSSDNTINKCNN